MMPSPATVRVLFVACLVAVLGTAAAQYDTGALVGTDSFYNRAPPPPLRCAAPVPQLLHEHWCHN